VSDNIVDGNGVTLSPEMMQMMDLLKEQFLICFVKRAGGKVVMPVAEVDDTSQDIMRLQVDTIAREFTLIIEKKS
jgi:hypothetical protein